MNKIIGCILVLFPFVFTIIILTMFSTFYDAVLAMLFAICCLIVVILLCAVFEIGRRLILGEKLF